MNKCINRTVLTTFLTCAVIIGCSAKDISILSTSTPSPGIKTDMGYVTSNSTTSVTDIPISVFIQASPTPTITIFSSTRISAPTTIPTLTELEAEAKVARFLKDNGGCTLCLWGMVPEKTTLTETKTFVNIFQHGGQIGDHYFSAGFSINQTDVNKYLEIEFQFRYNQNQIIDGIEFTLCSLRNMQIQRSEWSFYTLDNLLKVYGVPSHVEFNFPLNELGHTSYEMMLTYQPIHLVIDYSYKRQFPEKPDNFTVCPSTDYLEGLRLWYGENVLYVPDYLSDLKQLSSLGNEDFHNIFKISNNNQCIDLRNIYQQ